MRDARKPLIFEINGLVIGLYACVENEFSGATDECAEANPVDYLEMFDDITRVKEKCDYVIVLYHGRKEENRGWLS